MKKTNINVLAAAAALALCMMTGCAAISDSTENRAEKSAANTASAESTMASAEKDSLSEKQAATAEAAGVSFSERDLAQTADTSSAKQLTVKDGETINITEAGVYVLSGTAKECTVRVEAGDNDKVQLVLNGVEITNTDFPAVYVVNADKCFITTAEDSVNSFSVTGEFKADGENNTDAAVYSKDDLVLNGLGTLKVDSAKGNGISGKDDIKITGGTYEIACAKDAVEAKDTIAVCGGSIKITSDKDGFHAEDNDDSTKGTAIISGGTLDITAKSDGIQGTVLAQVDGGDITINSEEGIEAAYVKITGGTINITASDDGINASSGSAGSQNAFGNYSTESVGIEFTGGTTTINMAAGDTDGVDSNGILVISGGTISVNTQGNAFDCDSEPVFTGGTILVNGEEQSEVPEDMMGGGFGGRRPGGFNGQPPEGFEGKEPPEGFENFKGKGGRGKFGGRQQTESETESVSDT